MRSNIRRGASGICVNPVCASQVMLVQCWWRQHREHSARFGRAVLTSRLLAKQLVTGRRDDVDVGAYVCVVSQVPQVSLCGDTVVVCVPLALLYRQAL